MTRKIRRNFTDEFKKQMVDLFNAGKPRSEIIREYDLTPSSFNNWVKQFYNNQSFKHKDNVKDEQKELNGD